MSPHLSEGLSVPPSRLERQRHHDGPSACTLQATGRGAQALSRVASIEFYCNHTAIRFHYAIPTSLTAPLEPSLLVSLRTSNPLVTAAGFASSGALRTPTRYPQTFSYDSRWKDR